MRSAPILRRMLSARVSLFARCRPEVTTTEGAADLTTAFRSSQLATRDRMEKRTIVVLIGEGVPAHLELTVAEALVLLRRALDTNAPLVMYVP